MWDFLQIVEHLAGHFEKLESDLRLEQAVYGLDSHAELQLHEHLSECLVKQYSVAREVHYPSTSGNKLTHRQRCDMVLSPQGKPLKLDSKPQSLFDPPDQTDPSAALWLEVKTAYQFREGGQSHGGYSSQWRNAVVSDLSKMEADEQIHHAGLLLIVFTESMEVYQKDVQLFEDLLVIKNVIAGFRQEKNIAIQDRMGHRYCSIVIWPTIQR